MNRTIQETAELTGIAASTIRFYDRKGLLLRVRRNESGYRVFDDTAVDELRIVDFWRHAGMSIGNIRRLAVLANNGELDMGDRRELLRVTRNEVAAEIRRLCHALELIDSFAERYDAEQFSAVDKDEFQDADIAWMRDMLTVEPKKAQELPKK